MNMINKQDISSIERIIADINKLRIITKNKNSDYFYDSSEMIVLCMLLDNIKKDLNKVSLNIKNKYNNINWNLIEEEKNEYDEMKLGKVWILCSHKLYDELYNKLNELLEKEIPSYYKKWADKQVNY